MKKAAGPGRPPGKNKGTKGIPRPKVKKPANYPGMVELGTNNKVVAKKKKKGVQPQASAVAVQGKSTRAR